MTSPQHRAYQGQAGASGSSTGHSSYHATNGRHISDSPPPAPRPMMSISSILNDGGSVPKSPGISRASGHASHSHSATASHSMAGPSSPPPSKAQPSSPPSAPGRSTWATHAAPSRLPAPQFRDQHQHPSEQSHSTARASTSSSSTSGALYPRADYSGSQAPALAAPAPVSSASSEMKSSNGNGSYHPVGEEGHRTYSSSEAGYGGRSDQVHGQGESVSVT